MQANDGQCRLVKAHNGQQQPMQRSLPSPTDSCWIPVDSGGIKFGRAPCQYWHSREQLFWQNRAILELRPEWSTGITRTESCRIFVISLTHPPPQQPQQQTTTITTTTITTTTTTTTTMMHLNATTTTTTAIAPNDNARGLRQHISR